MMGAVAPITALLLSVFILFLGNGLQGTVLPIRGYSEAFSTLELGILGAIYYAGFTLGCLGCPIAIKRAVSAELRNSSSSGGLGDSNWLYLPGLISDRCR